MEQDLARRSVQAAIWSYLGAAGKIASQLVIQILLARMLGPTVYGQYAIVLVVIAFGWLFADSGFGAALIQKKNITEIDIGYALGWVLLVSMAIGAAIMLSAHWLANMLGDVSLSLPLLACGPIIILQALSNISTSLMRRNLDMKRYQIIQLSSYILGFGCVAMALALTGAGIWSLVIGFFTQTLITLIGSYKYAPHSMSFTLKGGSDLRKFGFSVLGTNLTNWAIENLDRVIIGRQWGIASLGAYSASINLSRVPVTLLVTSFQPVIFSSASRAQSDKAQLRRGYLAITSMVALAIFPLAAILAFKAGFVIFTLYGERWESASSLFAAICVGMPFFALLSITGPTLWALGLASKEFKVQVFTALALTISLYSLKNQAIGMAIWAIPVIYFFRFFFVFLSLGNEISVSTRNLISGIKGGLVLALIVGLIELAINSRSLFSSRQTILNLVQIAAEGSFCLLIVRSYPKFFFGNELYNLITRESRNSKVIGLVQRLLLPSKGKA